MAQVVAPLAAPPETTPNRIRWTRSQCDAIRDAEILTGRYELIDGEIISKMGQNPPHRVTVVLLHAWLISLFGPLFVQAQSSIEVADVDALYNEPEPDAAVTRQPTTDYLDRNPGPADLLMAVEVSDSTLRFDRSKKAVLYARAGIPDYWVLDINGRQVFIHRSPQPDGYAEIVAYSAGERISPLARPEALVTVADLLPPAD